MGLSGFMFFFFLFHVRWRTRSFGWISIFLNVSGFSKSIMYRVMVGIFSFFLRVRWSILLLQGERPWGIYHTIRVVRRVRVCVRGTRSFCDGAWAERTVSLRRSD